MTVEELHRVLEEIFDPDFSESNFGFRAGRSQQQAIRQLRRLVKEGRTWAVAVDLQSFFDEIPHGLILRLIRRKVADEPFVTLLARLLKAGVIVNGKFEKANRGCPQGSPLSPILSRGKIRVSTKAQSRFKDRVRELTRRNNPLSMYQVIHGLNKYLRTSVPTL